MTAAAFFFFILFLAFYGFYLARRQARHYPLALSVSVKKRAKSTPFYYAGRAFFIVLVPGLLALVSGLIFINLFFDFLLQSSIQSSGLDCDKRCSFEIITALGKGDLSSLETRGQAFLTLAQGHANALSWRPLVLFAFVVPLTLGLFTFVLKKQNDRLNARLTVERFGRGFMLGASIVAIVTTIGILISLAYPSVAFFQDIPLLDFFLGTKWNPPTKEGIPLETIRRNIGVLPVLFGTFYVAIIAMFVAIPIGLMAAIYISEYANLRFRTWAKPVLEILAGIPTIVYGIFTVIVVVPLMNRFFGLLSLPGSWYSNESTLAVGLVMGVMIIPFVTSLSDDAITAVPRALRDGSLGLGATKSETIKKVVLPAALPGIVGGILLAVSRAIGETMIVVLVLGAAANWELNPLEGVSTITVQIVKLITGDQSAESIATRSIYALGLTLFVLTLILNLFALRIVKKYREQYD